jgi:hypothetical protein
MFQNVVDFETCLHYTHETKSFISETLKGGVLMKVETLANKAKKEQQAEGRRHHEAIIEHLSGYKRIIARIKMLERYSVGGGITVSRLNEDDHLQELHRQLRGQPSYMYLTKREQELETTAHAYLTHYPAGTKAQLAAIPDRGADAEDTERLSALRLRIRKVFEARAGELKDYDAVLHRLAELQDLLREKEQYDLSFDVMDEYKEGFGRLLRAEFGGTKSPLDLADDLGVSVATYYRRRSEAIEAYGYVALGLS